MCVHVFYSGTSESNNLGAKICPIFGGCPLMRGIFRYSHIKDLDNNYAHVWSVPYNSTSRSKELAEV